MVGEGIRVEVPKGREGHSRILKNSVQMCNVAKDHLNTRRERQRGGGWGIQTYGGCLRRSTPETACGAQVSLLTVYHAPPLPSPVVRTVRP